MALQISLPKERTNVRLAAPAAYARIVQVLLDADTKRVKVAVNVYGNVDAAARPAPDQPPLSSPVNGNVFEGNLGKEIAGYTLGELYTWLKTLPDFAGALDV